MSTTDAADTTTPTERRDFGTLRQRGRIWWVRYKVNGKTYEESSDSADRRKAEKLLARRQAELGLGVFVAPDVRRTTLDDLCGLVRQNYAAKGNRSLPRAEGALQHLLDYFGGGTRAVAITTDRVTAYEATRLDADASRSTVNTELALLRRAFNLAVEAKRLTQNHVPTIHTPDPKNARQGFFEEADFRALLGELPEPLRPLMEFCYLTGWRSRDEAGALTWAQVDFGAGTVRLEPNTTKNDEGRVFPFAVLPPLRALLERQRAETKATERRLGRVIPFVFHRDGEPIRDYYGAWRSAIQRAAVQSVNGIEVVVRPALLGRVPHDFRRTAVRNLERAGVPRSVAMKLTGHKTESVYRRYAIVSEADLSEGVAKLAALHAQNAPRGTVGGQSGRSVAQGAR